MPLSRLPYDLLHDITEYLDLEETTTMRQVSHALKRSVDTILGSGPTSRLLSRRAILKRGFRSREANDHFRLARRIVGTTKRQSAKRILSRRRVSDTVVALEILHKLERITSSHGNKLYESMRNLAYPEEAMVSAEARSFIDQNYGPIQNPEFNSAETVYRSIYINYRIRTAHSAFLRTLNPEVLAIFRSFLSNIRLPYESPVREQVLFHGGPRVLVKMLGLQEKFAWQAKFIPGNSTYRKEGQGKWIDVRNFFVQESLRLMNGDNAGSQPVSS